MRYRDKHKTVFLRLLRHEKLTEHMWIVLHIPNTAWDIVT